MYNPGGAFSGPPSSWASGPATNLTNQYFAMDPSTTWSDYGAPFITECTSAGLIPFVELEPWQYTQAGILFSSITSGAYDTYLTAIGTSIAASGKICILTFAHEMNVSGQYPWAFNWTATRSNLSIPGCGPGGGDLTAAEHIAGWKYVHDKVNSTAGGLALWMWAPGADTGGSSTTSPVPWWPGTAYADMVGLDGYEALEGSPVTFSGVFGATLADVRSTIGWTGPVYVSETNLALMVQGGGDSVAAFVADMHASNMSGILEFEETGLPAMSSAQWTQYNNAVASLYGGGGGGGTGGAPTYTQTLYDGFSGSSVNPALWIEPVNSNGITVSGGTLKIQGLTNYEQVMVQTTPFSRNLADGIFGLQLTQSGAGVTGTMWFLGICDNYVSSGGNAYEFQAFPAGGSAGGPGSWYSWAFSGTTVSGDAGSQNILSPSVWNNGDWLGIGNYNINGSNDVHVYKSPDGATWTEIASFVVTGAINESDVGFYFGTNYDSGTTGTSTYLATIDNVSWFARGAPSGGGGTPPAAGLVQETSGSATGTSLTLTFPAAVTTGNAVIVAVCGYYNGTVTSLEVGGVTTSFIHVASAGGTGATNANIFATYNPAGGSAAVNIATSAAGIVAWAYEVAGVVTADLTAGSTGTGTSLASGATGATVPYPHFIIGAAAVIGSGATVTGPSSGGWTNEAAYHGVSTAHPVGGVSGYQQAPSSGTYSYTATASASAPWASVTAAFLAASPPVSVNTIWCGYKFSEHAAAGYTGVSATVTLPSTLPATPAGALCSVWVGLGPNINQTGVYLGYNAAKTGGVDAAPWSWWIGAAGERWDENAYPAGAGDSMTFTMELTAANWLMTMVNNTRHWTYTEVMSVRAANLNFWNTGPSSPYAPTTPQWVFPQNSAVIIIEIEAPNLPNFGSLNFTGITTTPAYTAAPAAIMAARNTDILDYPGPFNMADGSFTLYWHAFN